jgi:hypothetical protein
VCVLDRMTARAAENVNATIVDRGFARKCHRCPGDLGAVSLLGPAQPEPSPVRVWSTW